MDASSALAGTAESERIGSSQGGAVDTSCVPAGRAHSDPTAASTPTDLGNGEDTPAVLSGRATHELSNWRRLPATVRGRTRGQSQRMGAEPGQSKMNPEVGDALLAAAYECTNSRSLKGKDILEYGGRTGHDGWRTCGNERRVERVLLHVFVSVCST